MSQDDHPEGGYYLTEHRCKQMASVGLYEEMYDQDFRYYRLTERGVLSWQTFLDVTSQDE